MLAARAVDFMMVVEDAEFFAFLAGFEQDRARAVASVMRRGGLRDVVSTKGGDLKVTRVICGRR